MVHDFWNYQLIALIVMILIMTIVWIIHLIIRRADIVDIAWAYSLAILAGMFALLSPYEGLRPVLMAALVGVWGFRLGTHLLLRIAGHEEDGRYQQMRREGKGALEFFWFFQFQALLNVILCIPFSFVALNPVNRLGFFEYAGLSIGVIAIIGESFADAQLRRFKARTDTRGQVCRDGLWKYSRHPNYFFEWLIWVAIFVFACGSPLGWISVIGPLLMLYFLFKVTGIPATEAQARRSKGLAYAEYQRTTSAFVPWVNKQ
ncbi:MAG TPA: DUF1295 domain-containing protein [bacterium]|nr:DUF1295 domain-containing protein [bacterium]HMZ04116.1 DUF1295 domain-containing protein [bacterium]HNB09284.1 DUF1295 domain-containing protein [bacterium]HNB58353.1 DUF1295 domain-containing protein [bacterium]HND76426.1 DUF1295 domain-containing protein [bacterium]